MATVVSKINCATEDYNTLALWEDAKDGDLVTAQTIQQADCYADDGILSGGCTVDGSTTNASYFMRISSPAGERHTGIKGTGFILRPAAYGEGVNFADDYTECEWIESSGATVDSGRLIYGDAAYCKIKNCLAYEARYLQALYTKYGGTIIDTMVFNCSVVGITCENYGSGAPTILNCSVYKCTDGIKNGGSSVALTVRNCISMGNSGSDYNLNGAAAWGATSDKNISDDGTAPGATTYTSTAAEEWVNVGAGTEDLHLKGGATCDAIDHADDLGTTNGVNIDIDGYDRDATAVTWDIGADEYVASGSASSSPSASVSGSPSASISGSPSTSPSASVSGSPSASISGSPSASPSSSVSGSPSASPSASRSSSPSSSVSASPSASVSGSPSASISSSPSSSPSTSVSSSPSTSISSSPSASVSSSISASPSASISGSPSASPSGAMGNEDTYFQCITDAGGSDVLHLYIDGIEMARFKPNGDVDLHGVANNNAF
jgi:hypothetical protein